MANNARGNYLPLITTSSSGSDDRSDYMNDGTRAASMVFNDTPCAANFQNCHNFNGMPGVSLYFAGPTPGTASHTFIALDTTQYFTYEWLLLGSSVTYRMNGVSYSGTALPTSSNILVIGDGSSSSLPGLVPGPGSWPIL